MIRVINELNKLAFVIAPIFYKIFLMSIAALCIGIVILCIRRFADSKISPAWKYAMWLVVIVALAIPYRLETEVALLDGMARMQEISYRGEYDQISKNRHDLVNIEQPTPQQQTELISLQEEVQAVFLKSLIFDVVIPLLWLSGVIVMALFWFISRMRLMHKLKQHQHETNSKHSYLLKHCKVTLGIRSDIRLFTQDYIDFPALLGFVRPKIILPLYANELSDESLKYILLHELSHYKRFDILLNDILMLLQTVYWFNPLVWIMFRFIRQDMELANDAYVIKHIGNENSKNYSRSLVEVLSRYNNVTLTPKLLCMVDGKNNMERRIKMIKLGEYFKKRKILIAILSIALICAISTLFLTQSPSTGDTMKWANNLSVRDVERIELVVMPSSEDERYQLFEVTEYEDIVTLINQSRGKYINYPEELTGGAVTFYIDTKDGKRHTVTNIGNAQLFIDGDYYDAEYNWLSSWKYTHGNTSLPDDFSFEGNTAETKLQAFKGLELYVWKSWELTGNNEPYFTLLQGTNRNKEHTEIYDLDIATSDISAVGQMLSQYEEGLYLHISHMNEIDFTKEQMTVFADELTKYMPNDSSMSIGLFELPISSITQEEQQTITFWVKPDEPAQVIGEVAAMQWLNSYMGDNVLETERIMDYTINKVTVMAVDMAGSDDETYDYIVRVQYNITTATDEYFAPGDGVASKGTFDDLFRELCVKAWNDGNFSIVSVGTGGGEQGTNIEAATSNMEKTDNSIGETQTEDFYKLGVTILLPKNENWIVNPKYSIIDETIAQVEYYDEYAKTDMVLRAGKEDIQTLSGISYSFDDEREESWFARTSEDGSYIDIKVQYAILDNEMKGVLVSWNYKDINYTLWGSIADEEADVSPIAKTAVYIAGNMR